MEQACIQKQTQSVTEQTHDSCDMKTYSNTALIKRKKTIHQVQVQTAPFPRANQVYF